MNVLYNSIDTKSHYIWFNCFDCWCLIKIMPLSVVPYDYMTIGYHLFLNWKQKIKKVARKFFLSKLIFVNIWLVQGSCILQNWKRLYCSSLLYTWIVPFMLRIREEKSICFQNLNNVTTLQSSTRANDPEFWISIM